jgi:hypothetical protein
MFYSPIILLLVCVLSHAKNRFPKPTQPAQIPPSSGTLDRSDFPEGAPDDSLIFEALNPTNNLQDILKMVPDGMYATTFMAINQSETMKNCKHASFKELQGAQIPTHDNMEGRILNLAVLASFAQCVTGINFQNDTTHSASTAAIEFSNTLANLKTRADGNTANNTQLIKRALLFQPRATVASTWNRIKGTKAFQVSVFILSLITARVLSSMILNHIAKLNAERYAHTLMYAMTSGIDSKVDFRLRKKTVEEIESAEKDRFFPLAKFLPNLEARRKMEHFRIRDSPFNTFEHYNPFTDKREVYVLERLTETELSDIDEATLKNIHSRYKRVLECKHISPYQAWNSLWRSAFGAIGALFTKLISLIANVITKGVKMLSAAFGLPPFILDLLTRSSPKPVSSSSSEEAMIRDKAIDDQLEILFGRDKEFEMKAFVPLRGGGHAQHNAIGTDKT